MGLAIQEYVQFRNEKERIKVWSHLNPDEYIPVPYLFRKFEKMPLIEQKALELAKGKILDIGAAAGPHSDYLYQKGMQVEALEISEGAANYLRSKKQYVVHCENIYQFSTDATYDTILLLMNGIGIAKNIANLPAFLQKLASFLTTNGTILLESTDISYMYMDGDIPFPSNNKYHGEVRYRMRYKNQDSGLFDWLFIDFTTLENQCKRLNLRCTKLWESTTHSFLAKIEK